MQLTTPTFSVDLILKLQLYLPWTEYCFAGHKTFKPQQK